MDPPPTPLANPSIDAADPVAAPGGDGVTVIDGKFEFFTLEGQLELVYDHLHGAFAVCHTGTMEVAHLPQTAIEWLLDVDASGDQAFVTEVVADGDGRVWDVDDVLKHQLWQRTSDSEMFVRSGGVDPPIVRPLRDFRAAHKHTSVDIPSPLSSAVDSLRVAVFEAPRDGLRCFVALVSVLEVLDIKRQKALTFTINKELYAWDRVATAFGLPSGVMKTIPYDKNAEADGVDDGSRVLKEKACSMMLFLALLNRWAYCKPQGGGFKDGGDKGRAEHLVHRLCQFLPGDAGFKMTIFGQDGHTRNRCGICTGTAPFPLMVSSRGLVLFSDLKGIAQPPGSHLWRWLRMIDSEFNGTKPFAGRAFQDAGACQVHRDHKEDVGSAVLLAVGSAVRYARDRHLG